jgi:hypothetical protein
MRPLLRYGTFALANLAYLALVLFLVAFACTYLNYVFFDELRWNPSGTLRPQPIAVSLVAFGVGVAEALILLLLVYPANKRVLRTATPHAAAIARWTCVASWALAAILVYLI